MSGRLEIGRRTVAGAVAATLLVVVFLVGFAMPAAAATLSTVRSSGPPGSSVGLRGTGFIAVLDVTLCWDRTGCLNPVHTVPSLSGEIKAVVTVPGEASPGQHVIYACQALDCATAVFWVADVGDGVTTTVTGSTTTVIDSTTTTDDPVSTSVITTSTTTAPTTTMAPPPSTTTIPAATTTTAGGASEPTTTLAARSTTIDRAEGTRASASGPDTTTTTSTPEVLSEIMTVEADGEDERSDGPAAVPSGQHAEDTHRGGPSRVAAADFDTKRPPGPVTMGAVWLGVMIVVAMGLLGLDEMRRRRR